MKEKKISTLKIAATYIGTIIGAGFATGQESLQFFNRFGFWGLMGLIITTILLIIFGYIIMIYGRQLNAKSHVEIIKFSAGKWVGTLIDYIITFFLFGALTAMLAGTGALIEQQFNLPHLLGNIIMGAITAITVLKGLKGVIDSISFVVPFLLITVLGVCIYSIINSPPDLFNSVPIQSENELVSNWMLSAVLYVSYNTILSVAVLGHLGVTAKSKNTIRNGAILGGLGLGLGAILIYLALSTNILEASAFEIPMIYISGKISIVIQIIYTIVLIAEIYTTAVGSLYGLASRLNSIGKLEKRKNITIIGLTILAIIASQFGFSNLVKYLYPMVGYGGILLLISLIYVKFSKKRYTSK